MSLHAGSQNGVLAHETRDTLGVLFRPVGSHESMRYIQSPASPNARPLARCVWIVRGRVSDHEPLDVPLFPDGSAELCIARGDAMEVAEAGGRFRSVSRTLFIGPRAEPLVIRLRGYVHWIGVRFQPAGSEHSPARTQQSDRVVRGHAAARGRTPRRGSAALNLAAGAEQESRPVRAASRGERSRRGRTWPRGAHHPRWGSGLDWRHGLARRNP